MSKKNSRAPSGLYHGIFEGQSNILALMEFHVGDDARFWELPRFWMALAFLSLDQKGIALLPVSLPEEEMKLFEVGWARVSSTKPSGGTDDNQLEKQVRLNAAIIENLGIKKLGRIVARFLAKRAETGPDKPKRLGDYPAVRAPECEPEIALIQSILDAYPDDNWSKGAVVHHRYGVAKGARMAFAQANLMSERSGLYASADDGFWRSLRSREGQEKGRQTRSRHSEKSASEIRALYLQEEIGPKRLSVHEFAKRHASKTNFGGVLVSKAKIRKALEKWSTK